MNDLAAYNDFLRLIGKMCKKRVTSKYFANRIGEDNRMLVFVDGKQIGFDKYEGNADEYNRKSNAFSKFIHHCYNDKLFI